MRSRHEYAQLFPVSGDRTDAHRHVRDRAVRMARLRAMRRRAAAVRARRRLGRRYSLFLPRRTLARSLARNFRALLSCLGEPDRDRLLPALDRAAFAAATAFQSSLLPPTHRAFDALRCG